MTFNWITKTS